MPFVKGQKVPKQGRPCKVDELKITNVAILNLKFKVTVYSFYFVLY